MSTTTVVTTVCDGCGRNGNEAPPVQISRRSSVAELRLWHKLGYNSHPAGRDYLLPGQSRPEFYNAWDLCPACWRLLCQWMGTHTLRDPEEQP